MWLALIAALLTDSAHVLKVPVAPGETLTVTTAGHGAPVVLVPGLFGSAYGWRRVLALLTEAGYQAAVIEPLGVGTSSRPRRADYSLTAQSDRLAHAIEYLDLGPAVLVAQGVGGAIALRAAARYPALVRGLVSLEGGPAERAATPGFRRAMVYVPWVKWAGGVRVFRKIVRENLVKSSGDQTWITDDVIDAYTAGAAADLDGTLLAYLTMADAREPEPISQQLGAIRCPVLLVLGGAPHASRPPDEEVERLRERVRSYAEETVPGAGHYLQEERPDVVAAAVLRVDRTALAQTGGGGPSQ